MRGGDVRTGELFSYVDLDLVFERIVLYGLSDRS